MRRVVAGDRVLRGACWPSIRGTGDQSGQASVRPHRPTLEPNERLWLERYLERLKNAPGGLVKRLVVYGSKARGDAGPESDLDVLVLVKDAPGAAEHGRELVQRGDEPGGVAHEVAVRTGIDWVQDINGSFAGGGEILR